MSAPTMVSAVTVDWRHVARQLREALEQPGQMVEVHRAPLSLALALVDGVLAPPAAAPAGEADALLDWIEKHAYVEVPGGQDENGDEEPLWEPGCRHEMGDLRAVLRDAMRQTGDAPAPRAAGAVDAVTDEDVVRAVGAYNEWPAALTTDTEVASWIVRDVAGVGMRRALDADRAARRAAGEVDHA